MAHKGLCVLIGGPGASLHYLVLKAHFVKCFGRIPYQSRSFRSYYLYAIYNVNFLLLRDQKASIVFNPLPPCIDKASKYVLPRLEGSIEVKDLINLGHIGPILRRFGGDLTLVQAEIPPRGYREPPKTGFDRVLDTLSHGGVYIMYIFEANIVDHVIFVDRSRWPNLIYDPVDRYPIMMSSVVLF